MKTTRHPELVSGSMLRLRSATADAESKFSMTNLGKHDVSALHNILLFDYGTFEEIGWVY